MAGMGLSILAVIEKERAEKAAARAAGKAAKGEAEADPRYNGDSLERLLANTSVVRSKSGDLTLKVANVGPRPGKGPTLMMAATAPAIDELCANLKLLVGDQELLNEKVASFDEWAAAHPRKK